MPLVTVELVTDAAETPGLASALADAIGDVLGAAPGSTWVRLHHLPRRSYGESGGSVPATVQPVFLSVIQGRAPDAVERRRQARELALAVGRLCESPAENVHVIFEPDGAGRVAFGGRLAE